MGEPWREQNVGAEGGLDSEFLRERIGAIGAGDDLRLLVLLDRAGRELHRVFVVEERLDAEPDALVRHQLGGRFVHQMAVIDAFHAGRDRALDRGRGVGMDRDIGAPVFGRLDRGAQLGFGEGRDIDRAVRRRDAAARGQLDLRCAQHELLAHPHAHHVGAVGDHGAADLFDAAQRCRRARAGISKVWRKSPWPLVTVIIAPEG